MKRAAIVLAGMTLLFAASNAHAAVFYLYATDFHSTGVLDESAAQANAIDREEAGNAKTLAAFTVDVAAAYAADLGGVCTWGDAEGYRNDAGAKLAGLGPGSSGRGYNYFGHEGAYNGEYTKLLYGVSQSKALQMVPRRALEIWPQGYGGLYTSVSGPSIYVDSGGVTHTDGLGAVLTPETNYWNNDPDSDNTRETLNFTPLVAGETVRELGFVLLSPSGAQTVDVWVDYADLTSSPVRSVSIAGGTTLDDVFVYFAAGSSPITALHWDSNMGRPPMGDLAVIMGGGAAVPEPACLGLIGLALLAVRKRRS